MFVDRPDTLVTVRAQCDAIEIADLLLGRPPSQLPAGQQVARLHSWQEQESGLVAPLLTDGRPASGGADLRDSDTAYHVLCVGYALDLLGSAFPVPVRAVSQLSAADLVTALDALPWARKAWRAGHFVDCYGTAMLWNRRHGDLGQPGATEALFGWLTTRADPSTGMWGMSSRAEGLLQIVNGFYRASRGTFAQFDVPLPHSEQVIDTVLAHVRDPRYFRPERHNACNVLDVAHPSVADPTHRLPGRGGADGRAAAPGGRSPPLDHRAGLRLPGTTSRHSRRSGDDTGAAGNRDVAGRHLAAG